MNTIDRLRTSIDTGSRRRLSGALALSALLLAGCNDPSPYHEVVVGQNQTIDDIGSKECGPSLFGLSTLPRRNRLIDFNDLDSVHLRPGQRLKIPDSLCYDTGDKVKS